jgi:hypothetical protein
VNDLLLGQRVGLQLAVQLRAVPETHKT